MQVFYFTKLGELVGNILLRCLFMNIGDQDDPTLHSCASYQLRYDGKAFTVKHMGEG